jgi:hypothetical protein
MREAGAAPCRSTPAPAATSTPDGRARADPRWRRRRAALVLIENVGNLVCPALFDLASAPPGRRLGHRGRRQPIKYPHMFRSAQLVLINKIDLLPHVRFDVDAFVAIRAARAARAGRLPVSAARGDGMPRGSPGCGAPGRDRARAAMTPCPTPRTRTATSATPRGDVGRDQGAARMAFWPSSPPPCSPSGQGVAHAGAPAPGPIAARDAIRRATERLSASPGLRAVRGAGSAPLVEQIPAVTFLAVLGVGPERSLRQPHIQAHARLHPESG